MDYLCLDYNKYCYYNIYDIDNFINDYNSFIDNNNHSFFECWNNGRQDDYDRYKKHIKDRNIISSSYSIDICVK